MKISDGCLRISDSLNISDFSNSFGVLQHPQQYAYDCRGPIACSCICSRPTVLALSH